MSKPASGGGSFGLESKNSFTSVPFQVQALFGSFSSGGGSPTVCLGETSGTVAGGQTICGYAYTSGTNAGGYYVGLQTTTQSTFDRVSSQGAAALIKPTVVTPPTNLIEIVNWLGTGVETGYIQYGGSHAGDGGSGWTFNTFSFIDIGESGGSFSASGNFFYVDAFKSFYKNPTITNGIVQTASGATCSFTTNVAGVTYGGSLGITEGTNTLANANAIAITDTGTSSSNILINGANELWSNTLNSYSFFDQNTIYSSASQSYFVYPANTWSTANPANGNVIALTSVQEDTTIPVNTLSPNTIYTGLNIPTSQPGALYVLTIDLTSSC